MELQEQGTDTHKVVTISEKLAVHGHAWNKTPCVTSAPFTLMYNVSDSIKLCHTTIHTTLLHSTHDYKECKIYDADSKNYTYTHDLVH